MGPETGNDWTGQASNSASYSGANADTGPVNCTTPDGATSTHARPYYTDLESARQPSSPPSLLRRIDNMATQTTLETGSLSENGLKHFKTYKYSSVDKSPVSYYILRHYWNACVEFLPLWLAPNMVTLIGFFFILGNVALLTWMDPDLEGPKQSWVYYSYAIGVWTYSTMDNIDGKQARRTGTSSGLGELFDHGIDSLNCTLASLLETSAMALGPTYIGALTAIIPTLPMFFSTWETYHTHTLYLGYFNGPTEGLLIASLIMIFSGIYGPQIWHSPISDLFGHSDWFGNMSVTDAWAGILLGGLFIAHVPGCVINVYIARRAKGLAFWPTLLEWAPIAVFTGSLMAWIGSQDSILLSENHLCLLCLTLSLVFGRMTTKIILAHLTRQPFPYWTVMLFPLVLGAALVNLPYIGLPALSPTWQLRYLWGYFFMANVAYFRWAYLVVTSICNYLGINCLTIPEDKWRVLEQEQRKQKDTAVGSKSA